MIIIYAFPFWLDQRRFLSLRPCFFFIIFSLFWRAGLAVVTPRRNLHLANSMTVNRQLLLLLKSLGLNLFSESLKGLFNVFLFFLFTAHWLKKIVIDWVSINLQLNFELVFDKVRSWDGLTWFWLLTVVALRGTCEVRRLTVSWIWVHWGRVNYYLIV